jgi:hypothetical protein
MASWSHDDLSRPLTITQPISGTVYYRYEPMGDSYQQTANGETVTYTLDIASDFPRC